MLVTLIKYLYCIVLYCILAKKSLVLACCITFAKAKTVHELQTLIDANSSIDTFGTLVVNYGCRLLTATIESCLCLVCVSLCVPVCLCIS